MSAAFVEMEPKSVSVDPGTTASVKVTVRNVGREVDVLRLETLGRLSTWTTIEPAELHLLPGVDGTAVVTFKPPRDSSVAAGPAPFGIRATSTLRGETAVEEGQVEVRPFASVFAELVPKTARGRRRGRVDLAIDNRGNTPFELHVAGVDSDGVLTVETGESELTCGAGGAVFTPVDVRPTTTFWRGVPRSMPFKVQLTDASENVLTVDGTMVQEPILPKWFFKALLGVLAALIALLILWFTVLRPAVKSAAGDAAAEKVAAVVEPMKDAAESAKQDAGAAKQSAAAAEKSAEGAATPAQVDQKIAAAVADTPGAGKGSAVDFRLGVNATHSLAGKRLALTDVVLQNPKGDTGTIQIKRGDTVLLEVGLENFRDLDYHYVTPIVFDGVDVSVAGTCAGASGACTAAVSFGGVESTK